MWIPPQVSPSYSTVLKGWGYLPSVWEYHPLVSPSYSTVLKGWGYLPSVCGYHHRYPHPIPLYLRDGDTFPVYGNTIHWYPHPVPLYLKDGDTFPVHGDTIHWYPILFQAILGDIVEQEEQPQLPPRYLQYTRTTSPPGGRISRSSSIGHRSPTQWTSFPSFPSIHCIIWAQPSIAPKLRGEPRPTGCNQTNFG